MQRSLLTLVTVLCIAGLARGYAALVVPWTESVAAPTPPPLSDGVDFHPPVFTEAAEKYFPDAAWTRSANLKWQRSVDDANGRPADEEAFLFARSIDREEGSGNMVRMSPLAILWRDPRRPEAAPYRLIAEKARVQFENRFFDSALELSEAQPGRIVWASLEGKVHIDGPDGLSIDGHHFIFSEESAQLYSDYPIAFRYGPTAEDGLRVAGSAEQITLNLEPSSEPVLGADMPRIGGLAGVLLRRNVMLNLAFEQGGRPSKARITSAGPFEYDVEKRLATFESQVQVTRFTQQEGTAKTETLNCEWLGIELEETAGSPADASPPSGEGLFDGLQFRRMRATGSARRFASPQSKVVLESQVHDLHAVMQELRYDAPRRVAVMFDDEQVIARRGNARFACPSVRIEHTEEDALQRLECLGAGMLAYADERLGPEGIEATWAGRVDVFPDETGHLHVVQLDHDAQVVIPEQMAMAADRMRLWLDLGSAASAESEDVLRKPLPLQRARAEGKVRLVSSDLIVRHAESIDATIRPGSVVRSGDSTPGGKSEGPRQRENSAQPWIVWSDEIDVAIVHDPAKGELDVRRVVGTGDVRVQHQPQQGLGSGQLKTEGPLELSGIRLVAINAGGMDQTVTIFGDVAETGDVKTPALLSLGPVRIGGVNIVFRRLENRARIEGAGGLQVPLERGLNGEELEKPQLLEVSWQEGMDFDGETAHFFGSVRSSLKDQQGNVSKLDCEDLAVQLNARISFVEPNALPEDLTIEWIRARHQVQLEAYEYERTRLTGIRKGKLDQFQVTQSSGEFTGVGPGYVDVWSFGDAVRIAPTDTAQANQPVKPSPPRWRYSNVRFSGKIVGNIHKNVAELRERVEFLSAPVDEALMKFKHDDLFADTPQAANAVWLQCDRLRITQNAFGSQDRKFAEIFAYGNTELQGQFGRAVADELSFDERRGQFILRGLGRPATLYFQRIPGEPISPSTHRLIKFIPHKRSIEIDGSSGGSGGF